MAQRFSASGSRSVAMGGVLAAGSFALLWLACVTPAARMGLTAAAGLFPMAAVLTAGRGAGYLCWSAAGLLGVLILPDKGVALLYLLFLGVYPVVKSRIESLRRLPMEWLLKLILFNLPLTLFWFAMKGLFLPNPPAWLNNNHILLYGVGNGIFIVYDIGLSRLVGMLQRHIGRRSHS